jgi:hypothetical protein
MPLVYLAAIRFGATGLAWGWLVSFPLLLAFTIYQARPHIGFRLGQLAGAVVPGLCAAASMAALVWLFDRYLWTGCGRNWMPILHLLLLAGVGALIYGALLWFGSRATAMEVVNLVVRRKASASRCGLARLDRPRHPFERQPVKPEQLRAALSVASPAIRAGKCPKAGAAALWGRYRA